MILNIRKKDLSKADRLLIGKVTVGVREKGITLDDGVKERIERELNTIIEMGFSDYLLIVMDFLDIGRKIGRMPDERFDYLKGHFKEMELSEMVAYIEEDTSMPGMSVGVGRGSAAGSMVAFLTGITNIDPMENDLLFERFLNPERVSMPDIDSDLSKSEYDYGVRDIVIEYVAKKYGKDAICSITTPSTLAARAAIVNMARICGDKKAQEMRKEGEREEKIEKVKSEFFSLGAKMNRYVPEVPGVSLKTGKEDDPDHVIREKFSENEDALMILDMAEAVEGLNINYGRHACGMIIADNGDIGAYAPLMMDEDGWKVQMNAEQAEEAGLLKMDFLGLKTLNIITKCVRFVYRNRGIKVDCSKIEELPDVYREVFSKGKTNAVFQFESDGMKSMLKRFHPASFSDIVLLVACYRPGPMQYLDGIIRKKHGLPVQESAVSLIGACDKIVKPTYGAIVYQEQVQQIFRDLAGYSLGQADLVRRAMGHKKKDVLAAEKKAFIHGDFERGIDGCKKRGISEELAACLFDEMTEFAKYAFNKSHAAAYARTAYITAYLKLKYPTEFYAAVLDCTDFDKYRALIKEASDFGVKVKAPDINRSKNGFDGQGDEIFFGFSGIKGVGNAMAEEKGGYSSFPEFILETGLGKGMILTLIEAGVFDSFCANRKALLDVLPDYMREKENIVKKKKAMETHEEMLQDKLSKMPDEELRKKFGIKTKSIPSEKKLKEKIDNCKVGIADSTEIILHHIVIPALEIKEDGKERLEKERERLGMYVSGHPLDPYGDAGDYDCKDLCDFDDKTTKLYGMITNLRHTFRKRDGKPMAFFELEDRTGSIHVCCFTKQYEEYGDVIKEGSAVIIKGAIKTDDEGRKNFVISGSDKDAVCLLDAKKDVFLIELKNGVEDFVAIRDTIKKYSEVGGHKVRVFDDITGEFINTKLRVSDKILDDKRLKPLIIKEVA